MNINYIDNLADFMDDKGLSSKTKADFEYIRKTREAMNVNDDSSLLNDWGRRYSDSNIRNAKSRIRRLDTALHEGEAIHLVNTDRFDRASDNMREYCALNPVTRRRLLKQTLELPHTDRLPVGNPRLKSNFKYREVVNGVSTHYTKNTTVYSDAEEYIGSEDRVTILSSWDRMLRNLKNK